MVKPPQQPRNVLVHEKLRTKLRPLTDDERAGLLAKLMLDGCTEPFPYCVVEKQAFQLDGHHRRAICDDERIAYSWELISSVTTIEEAEAWVAGQQGHRRNVDEKTARQLRKERMDRIIGRRQDGESLRTIADAENVSVPQVQRDLKNSGVSPPIHLDKSSEDNGLEKPELCVRCARIGVPSCDECRAKNARNEPKITGKDGKQYSPTRPPPARKPRGPAGSGRGKRGPENSGETKSGEPVFSMVVVNDHLAKVKGELCKLLRQAGHVGKESPGKVAGIRHTAESKAIDDAIDQIAHDLKSLEKQFRAEKRL